VSTSNEILDENAIVVSDKPVLWTVEIREAEEKLATNTMSQPIRRHKRIDLP
jgi:hypothetical protein